MTVEQEAGDFVKDPLIELLAIKLYEHDQKVVPEVKMSWLWLAEDDRECYRKMARGEAPLELIPERD